MAKKNAELETVTSTSGIISISQQSFSSHFKGITSARDSKSFSTERSHQSNHKIPAWTGALKKVFKTYDKKSRRHEFGEWSLEEGRHFIMELAKELNKGWENPIIPSNVTGEEVCSLEECRSFIVKWADELDKLYQNSAMPSSVSSEEMCNLEECRSFIMKWADELDKLNEWVEGEEQRLREGQHIIMEWARELKRVPENSLSAGEEVSGGLAELVKEWKRGKLRNILPIMEFIMQSLIKEKGIVTQMWLSKKQISQNSGWNSICNSSVDVTLDSNTANPLLTLSADGKRVRLGEEKQAVPDNPQRFDHRLCVLGREGFTSGRHYWEVEVGENTFWRLGVTSESAERKRGFIMTPQHGYWTIEWWEIGNQFSALIDPHAPLPLSMKPRKLGVYLDYEEGQLSFYNVEARSLIYTFIDFNTNEKLYPVFWTMDREIDLMLQSTVSTGN